MKLTLYWSGRSLSLLGYWWAKRTRYGTLVNYGLTFRVKEPPEEIERLDIADDEAAYERERRAKS